MHRERVRDRARARAQHITANQFIIASMLWFICEMRSTIWLCSFYYYFFFSCFILLPSFPRCQDVCAILKSVRIFFFFFAFSSPSKFIAAFLYCLRSIDVLSLCTMRPCGQWWQPRAFRHQLNVITYPHRSIDRFVHTSQQTYHINCGIRYLDHWRVVLSLRDFPAHTYSVHLWWPLKTIPRDFSRTHTHNVFVSPIWSNVSQPHFESHSS